MVDIIIARRVQQCPGLTITETVLPSKDVLETIIFNPTEYMSFTTGILETAIDPVESMTYIN